MSLVEKVNETTLPPRVICDGERSMVYSPKLGNYVPLETGNARELQKYNVGLGPGSWY